VSALLLALGACSGNRTAAPVDPGPSPKDGAAGRYAAGSAGRAEADGERSDWLEKAYPVVEGLHVTGTPVEIDIDAYRLKVIGAVKTPLSLSYAEVQALPRVRSFVRLTCPGFFHDEGYWTGTPLKGLLEQAGIRDGAQNVRFVAADGGYQASLKLSDALAEGVLIAFQFDDRPFPKVHGFPLRVVAPGQAGSQWVKWLGQIVVE
jgi:DMSO/TMAO reductase YedYZ molybdopterin-dependent catalytic subunit